MSPARVVVDGSNIATEGSNRPSLRQLDEAVRAFLEEHPHDELTVVVDATFGHRIPKAEQKKYEEAVEAGELISPPAGAVGRGDAFILTIADKTNAVVLSNDSFQEFHGEHAWLFDNGRLIGGKPVPEVGWIFQKRVPVRGPKSRRAVKDAKQEDKQATRGPAKKGASRRRGKRVAKKGEARKGRKAGKATATDEERGAKGDGEKRRRRRGRGGVKPREAVNSFEDFIEFASSHPPGSIVEAEVSEYSSHGAYADANGVRCYVPVKLMDDPIPRAARDVMKIGEMREFVVNELDAPRRAVELAVPGFETVVRVEAAAGGGEAPLPGYDDLTARQITGALGNLELDELEALAAYEESHRNRKTVLESVETRIGRVRREVERAADEALAKKKAAARKKTAAARPANKKAGKKKAATKKKAAAKKRAAKKKPSARKRSAKKKSPAKKRSSKRSSR